MESWGMWSQVRFPKFRSKITGCLVKFKFQKKNSVNKFQVLHGTTWPRWNHVKTGSGHWMSAQWKQELTNQKRKEGSTRTTWPLALLATKSSSEQNPPSEGLRSVTCSCEPALQSAWAASTQHPMEIKVGPEKGTRANVPRLPCVSCQSVSCL